MSGGAHRIACRVALPPGFRPQAVLAFHGRDGQSVAEQVVGQTVRKGLLWAGQAACLSLAFLPEQVNVQLAVDQIVADTAPPHPSALTVMVRRMLGLSQAIAPFEQQYATHPELGPLLARQAGLRVPVAASPFEALSWAVLGQQLSVHAAVSIRRKLILACGRRHSSGLWCAPDAAILAALDEAAWQQAGVSAAKVRTLRRVAQQLQDGVLALEPPEVEAIEHEPQASSAAESASSRALAEWFATLSEALLAIPGIGPWTVNYTLLRGYGWLDGSLHGDVAVRRALQGLLGQEASVDARQAEVWLDGFRPWRALVAAHLWASLSTTA